MTAYIAPPDSSLWSKRKVRAPSWRRQRCDTATLQLVRFASHVAGGGRGLSSAWSVFFSHSVVLAKATL